MWLAGLGLYPGRGRQLLELHFDGGDVRIEGLVEQAELRRIKPLAALAELPTLQDRHLVRELVNLGLAVLELAVLAGEQLLAAGRLIDQRRGQRAQLLGVQAA
jgi:hypothetical protein